MKRLLLITLTVFLNLAFFSCTDLDEDTEYQEKEVQEQGCCGQEGDIDPPPPPPPTDETGG